MSTRAGFNTARLSVGSVGSGSRGNLGLPLVTVGQELLLVVQQFLTGLSGVFSVGGCARQKKDRLALEKFFPHIWSRKHNGTGGLTLDNGIDGAGFLAVAAVDTLGHVDIISGRPTATVLTLLGFDGDGLGRADGLAELASNAALLTGGITSQSVFATEPGRDGTLLEGVEDRVTGVAAQGQFRSSSDRTQHRGLRRHPIHPATTGSRDANPIDTNPTGVESRGVGDERKGTLTAV